MHDAARDTFRYLNREGRWADFHWSGLELRADGSLRLSSMPALDRDAKAGDRDAIAGAAAPSAPAGIALGAEGSLDHTDPDRHRIYVAESCDGHVRPAPCLEAHASEDDDVRTPRGLFIAGHRPDLFVADAARHRITIVDPGSWSVMDVWGEGLLQQPSSLAGDASGALYVADEGTHRAYKFTRTGEPAPAFAANVAASGLATRPAGVAVVSESVDRTNAGTNRTTVFILDLATHAIVLFNDDGTPRTDASGQPIVVGAGTLDAPLVIAATASALYVGDNGLQRVVVFRKQGADRYELVGTAPGFEGFATALTVTAAGDLLVLSPDGAPPVRLVAGAGFVTRGQLWSQPLSIAHRQPSWRRLRADVWRPDAAHLQLFFRRWSGAAPPAIDPMAPDPFSGNGWTAVPLDLFEAFIGGEGATFFQVAATFTGDSRATAVLSQMHVSFDDDGYMAHLPELYREEGSGGDFLPRFLALLESPFGDAERRIEAVATLIDPDAAPPGALPWLASFLGLELAPDLAEAEQRRAITRAFDSYARRGTVAGLRDAIRSATGVNAIVEEPIAMTHWWALPSTPLACDASTSAAASSDQSRLGFTTVLAEANPQGAVVGTTATLDQSHLIAQEDFGSPLFESVAYQFAVLVYAGEVRCRRTLDAVRAVIEREKPAHTRSHLCVIEAGSLQVGFQARLGIDTVLGGEAHPTPVGAHAGRLVVAGQPAGRLGEARVGSTTWL